MWCFQGMQTDRNILKCDQTYNLWSTVKYLFRCCCVNFLFHHLITCCFDKRERSFCAKRGAGESVLKCEARLYELTMLFKMPE